MYSIAGARAKSTAARLADQTTQRFEARAQRLEEMRKEMQAAQDDCEKLWNVISRLEDSKVEIDFDKHVKKHADKILATVDTLLGNAKELQQGLLDVGKEVVTQHYMAMFEVSENIFNTGWKVYANHPSHSVLASPQSQSGGAAEEKINDLERSRANLHNLQSWLDQHLKRIDNFLDNPLIKEGAEENRATLIKSKDSLLPLKTMYQCGELDLCSQLIDQRWDTTHPEFLGKKAPINEQFDLTTAALAKSLFYDLHHSTSTRTSTDIRPTPGLDPRLRAALMQLTVADQRVALAGQSENLSKIAHGYKWLIEEFHKTPEAKAAQQKILNGLKQLIGQQPAKQRSPLLAELKRVAASSSAQPVFNQLQDILSAPDTELTAASTALRTELGKIQQQALQAHAQQVVTELHTIVQFAENLARVFKHKFNQLPPDLAALSMSPAMPAVSTRMPSTAAKPASSQVRVIQTEFQGILVGTAGERDPETVEIRNQANTVIGTYRARDSEHEIWAQEPEQERIPAPSESNLVKLREYFSAWQAQAKAALNNAESWQDYSRRALENDQEQSASSVHGCLMNHAHHLKRLADSVSRRLSALSGADAADAAALYARGQQESNQLRVTARGLEQESQAAAARMIGQRPTWAGLRHWLALGLPINVKQTETGKDITKTAPRPPRHTKHQTQRQYQLQPDPREDYLHAFDLTLNPQSTAPVVVPLHLHTSSAAASPANFKKAHFKIGSQEFDGATSMEASGNPNPVYRSDASQRVVQRILALAGQQPGDAASATE